MPIYTYECQSCSSSLERRQSFNDEPLKTHDDCGGSLRRVIYPA
ncbi:MAG TPA: zinc ribbon domain-containing protein, partial [Chloroflexota bacterium]|nr:zinc ribbon domain-containing protein [Chloroflexota bacterium]